MRKVLSWAVRLLLRKRPGARADLAAIRRLVGQREVPVRDRLRALGRLLLGRSWPLVDTPANSARFARFVAYMRTTSRSAE